MRISEGVEQERPERGRWEWERRAAVADGKVGGAGAGSAASWPRMEGNDRTANSNRLEWECAWEAGVVRERERERERGRQRQRDRGREREGERGERERERERESRSASCHGRFTLFLAPSAWDHCRTASAKRARRSRMRSCSGLRFTFRHSLELWWTSLKKRRRRKRRSRRRREVRLLPLNPGRHRRDRNFRPLSLGIRRVRGGGGGDGVRTQVERWREEVGKRLVEEARGKRGPSRWASLGGWPRRGGGGGGSARFRSAAVGVPFPEPNNVPPAHPTADTGVCFPTQRLRENPSPPPSSRAACSWTP